MKPIWIAAIALTVALAVSGCKNRKEEPVPAPNAAAWPTKATLRLPALSTRANAPEHLQDTSAADGDNGDPHGHGASGISWFQGSFEEAFSIACSCHCYHFGLKH
jgi:hypothetical protein